MPVTANLGRDSLSIVVHNHIEVTIQKIARCYLKGIFVVLILSMTRNSNILMLVSVGLVSKII